MRVVIAPDSFKGSLSSPEVAAALERGWLLGAPDSACVRVPLADGGEGTVQALVDATGGRLETRRVTGPLGAAVDAAFGLLGGSGPLTAVVEVAAASGLTLVEEGSRDAGRATSYGTGELIAAALDLGARRLVIGLGGSACTDGGVGLLQALGARFVDAGGADLGHGGAVLGDLADIDLTGLHPALTECEVVAACDVDNPLTGPRGAAAVFGPQKGADEATVALLDDHLGHLAGVVAERFDADPSVPGSGAAGGIGFALTGLLGGELRPGIDLVADAVGLDELLTDADLVLTGEGCLDAQSLAGKAPVGVLRRARERGLPVIGVAGSLGEGVEEILAAGMTAVVSVVPGVVSLEEALGSAAVNLESTGRALASIWSAAGAAGS
ncbi:glycerate kinase [Nocardioides sp. BGMRC 2183]|nr:glycerate kinase [Nocardioides sp. BGMRC 2183]